MTEDPYRAFPDLFPAGEEQQEFQRLHAKAAEEPDTLRRAFLLQGAAHKLRWSLALNTGLARVA